MPSVGEILRYLEAIRTRKSMYFGEVDVKAALQFLGGFLTGCAACGFPVCWEKWRVAAKARGWSWNGRGPVPEMESKGMSAEHIIDELIAIHEQMVRQAVEEEA